MRTALLNYRSPAATSEFPPNYWARVSCSIAIFMVAWFIWGEIQLLNAFYSGPGNARNIPNHRRWWYIVNVGGALIAVIGVVAACMGMRKRDCNRTWAIVGAVLNAVALVGYAVSIPYPD